jgi:hypothetical protein
MFRQAFGFEFFFVCARAFILFLRQLDGSVLLAHYTLPVMCIPLSDGMLILIQSHGATDFLT